MRYILPSLSALQAFEAVARHLSFKDAAFELNLTPGAISQKIKKLEDQLTIVLFDRSHTQIKLTNDGRDYLSAIRLPLLEISEATRALKKKDGKSTINVSVTPLFAIKLFIPALSGFNRLHPDVTINTRTSVKLVDFEVEDVDVAIRHGLGHYPGLISQKLFTEKLIPVCSPSLLTRSQPLKTVTDLRHHTLLHHDHVQDWLLWFASLGIQQIDAKRGPRFSDDGLVIQAAIEGQGIALGRSALVQGDIDKGLLVAPLDTPMPSHFAYYLVYPSERHNDPVLQIFINWILHQSGLVALSEEG